MTAKIATIHGGRAPGDPSEEIIEDLERLLEEARSGRLIGIAYASCYEDGVQGTGWCGVSGTRHPLGTAVMILNHRYSAGLVKGNAK